MIADLIDLPVARGIIAAIGATEAGELLALCCRIDEPDQQAIERFETINNWRREIVDRDGSSVLTAIMDLGNDCYWEDGAITMPGRTFPDTLANAIGGRSIADVIGDNPLFLGMTVDRMTCDEAGTVIEAEEAGRTLEWIMSSIDR